MMGEIKTPLDNIERMFGDYDDEHVSLTMTLLVRAVRELGDVYKSTFPQRELSPDVLELLEERDWANDD